MAVVVVVAAVVVVVVVVAVVVVVVGVTVSILWKILKYIVHIKKRRII